jgi:xanthine dehydrogenase YagR molybdenum-binding subunit
MTISPHPLRPAIGSAQDRLDGPQKVTGAACYAFEYPVDRAAYLFPVQSTIARGRVAAVDGQAAQAVPGVLTVLWYGNAPRLGPLDDADLAVFQSDEVAYRGQFVAAVVAETAETARYAASLVNVRYEEQPHHAELRPDRGDVYKPEVLGTGAETDTFKGDVDAALAAAPITLDQTYITPAYHNNPLEPHTTAAVWHDGSVTLYDSDQGVYWIIDSVAKAFRLPPEQIHIVAPFVGGGFGSKGFAHPQVILAVMAAQVTGRAVKFALTRQQMFAVAGYRPSTIQHIRLGADRDGRLQALANDVIAETGAIHEFTEPAAVPARIMYAAPNRRTTHRLARLDIPEGTWMRAPGECPGMFALESAMDELAIACKLDPIELRVRNEPAVDPESGKPFSSRGLVACLREGAQRFGWSPRDPQPRQRQSGRWLIGTGVAASTYPYVQFPAVAKARVEQSGRYRVSIAAADIGTGALTVLTQIAADALEAPLEHVQLEIGDSMLPPAGGAGGSSGTTSWGSAIVAAARNLRKRLHEEYGDTIPDEGLEALGRFENDADTDHFSIHAFGAQFAEAHVNIDTGEVRVPRLLGVFAAGHILNPKTARSQFLGGMTMGLSMALHEESVLDPRFGDFVNHDFAEYHIATNADVRELEILWVDEDDPHINPMGSKGIGEIGIVGTAAAIANAVAHATGVRVRELPITLDKFLN